VDVPVIEFGELTTASGQDQLRRACSEWGFFKLVGHPVSGRDTATFLAEMRRFFALPAELKRKIERTGENPWGYFDRELTKNRRDWKEIFDFGIDQGDGRYQSRSQWPDLPGFRDAMYDWFGVCEAMAGQLVAAITTTLGRDRELLAPCFRPTHTSFLRLNYYPVCDDPAPADAYRPTTGNLGISHHTDAGAVTVLLPDDVAGLQVEKNGQWTTITPEPGAFIINIGDMVEVWSNGEYAAPLHRVLANRSRARYSAAFFYNPSFATDVVPLREPARFRPVNWGEFRAGRAAGDFADYGTEVQISDYRIAGVP